MHTLVIHTLVIHTLVSFLNGCLECCDDLLLRQGKAAVVAAPGWVTAGKPTAVVVIEVLGY